MAKKWVNVKQSTSTSRKGHHRQGSTVSTSKAFRITKHERNGTEVKKSKKTTAKAHKRRPRRTKAQLKMHGPRAPLTRPNPKKKGGKK